MLELKPMQFGTATVLVITAAFTLFLGIVPGHVLEAAQRATITRVAGQTYLMRMPVVSVEK
jgi:hypothetical protein